MRGREKCTEERHPIAKLGTQPGSVGGIRKGGAGSPLRRPALTLDPQVLGLLHSIIARPMLTIAAPFTARRCPRFVASWCDLQQGARHVRERTAAEPSSPMLVRCRI
jgi:hypothetical protein